MLLTRKPTLYCTRKKQLTKILSMDSTAPLLQAERYPEFPIYILVTKQIIAELYANRY
jgi:hypothetical protein